MPNRFISVIVVIGSAFLSLGYYTERERLIKKGTERERLIKKGTETDDDKKAIESFTFRLIGAILLLIASLIQLWLSFKSPFHTGVFGLGTHYVKYQEELVRSRYQGNTEVF